MDDKFALVPRVNDLSKAEATLKQNNVAILSLGEIKQFSQ
jgi:hypothetical protein